MENQQSFWQFSDQLREQTSNLANLSVNDSIWSTNLATKRPEERKNFDIRVGGGVNNSLGNLNAKGSDFNGFNDGWNSLKPKRSDINGINDGWSSLNGKGSDFNGVSEGWSSLKPKGSDFNGINDGWNSFKGKVSDFNGVNDGWNSLKPKMTDFNGFNDGWKMGASSNGNVLPYVGSQKSPGINGGFDKGIYSKPGYHSYNSNIVNVKGYKNGGKGEDGYGGKAGKKNSNANKKNSGENNNDGKDGKSAVDKRFKTLPPSESLPRNETVGGYIFVCNNDTMQENLKRQLFGLPPRYRDSVRAITPGLPLFLYNYSTHQLHGVFEAASFGGTNIDPTAWEDKKCPGESRFPAQVQVVTRKVCEPLEEDSFRPVLHHYDGPKFRLELNIPEALSLLDIFEGQNP
ncbi:hypothetical protein FH972_011978 [Carpinus fangiana]|uniref:DCD domain-containing protein n=1 Tax=Carpinus fangiana TaxID=176857 RepID=A0A5N6R5V1_9ROSI|nr:hypothetical protein FH972_011978 [Carpinus fangiana]